MINKHLRKFVAAFAMALAMCLPAALTAFAAEARINFSDPEVEAGNEVNVSMKITSDEGALLGDATVMLSYPAEKLEFVSGTDSDGGAGAIRVHGATNGKGTSVLEYNLKFNTVSAGQATIAVTDYEVYDTDDKVVSINHTGSSLVTIKAVSEASSECSLGTLEVYPGELTPAFSSDVDTYAVTVGTGVDRLTVNAIPADSSASVTISGNENLPDGDSSVTITVDASDGESTLTYTINVSKVEGGPENVISETGESSETVDGVQLSSKGKTITIINPSEDVVVPEGLRQGIIKIDDQKVQGWVWDADESPEYCVVYGMNDSGELNFYRYDMVEKTIQRYFEDPIAASAVSGAEYSALEELRDAAETSSNLRFVIICILAAVIFILFMVIIYLSTRLRAFTRQNPLAARAMERNKKQAVKGKKSENAAGDGTELPKESRALDTELLKHDYKAESNVEVKSQPADETLFIKRSDRKRKARHVSSDKKPEAVQKPETPAEGTKAADFDAGTAKAPVSGTNEAPAAAPNGDTAVMPDIKEQAAKAPAESPAFPKEEKKPSAKEEEPAGTVGNLAKDTEE